MKDVYWRRLKLNAIIATIVLKLVERMRLAREFQIKLAMCQPNSREVTYRDRY